MLSVLNKGRVPVKLWTNIHEVESAALDQLTNLSTLPFVFKHVSVMPDVHVGKGATVGTVLPTVDAIIPAAIGVDIGCFVGSTLIPLLDNTSVPIKDLVDKGEFLVFSCNEYQKITVSKATAKLTRKEAQLIAVTLDNGQVIKCTPDHEFMLRDGTYKAAELLSPNTSLMPFYKSIDKDGYVHIQQPYSGNTQKVHWMVARSGLMGEIPSYSNERTVIHHKDFDETNNLPNNLQFMSASEHAKYHRSLVERNLHWQSPEFELNRIIALKEFCNTEKGKELRSRNLLNYMKEHPEHFKESVKDNGKRGSKYLSAYNQSDKGKAKSKEISNRLYNCSTCNEQIKSPIGLHNHKRGVHGFNHKVVKVEILNEYQDVYCLTVPEYSNFALDAGVFVHNCGMMARKLPYKLSDLPDSLDTLYTDIEWGVPTGHNQHKVSVSNADKWEGWNYETVRSFPEPIFKLLPKALLQLGTLGSGNHFIEICGDEDQNVWVMLHSGSRHIGKALADFHINEAKGLMKKMMISLPDPDLSYLVKDTPEFEAYWNALQWAQRYALKNRALMMDNVMKSISKVLVRDHNIKISPLMSINCHHNYAELENHYGKNVYVTRKGAVRARKEDYGIIPGSMGTRSYIVRGKGNEDSFCSCSHGAGRRYSRTAAKGKFTIEDLAEQTKGVRCKKDSSVLDEIPGAYKDIDQVMENQKDLVEVIAVLKQVLCVKG